jgi:lipopolysaccharide export system permease protein
VSGAILFRMILWELVKVFVMALVAITGILLMAGLIAEASQQGLAPAQVLAAIPLLIPSTLPFTIPATTLFATCVVYGRLSADNEVLAIKAAGVNLLQVVTPGLVLGVAMSVATMGLYYRVIPYTHHLLRSLVLSDAEELLYSLLRRHGMIHHPQLSYSMFIKGVEGKKLLSPVFKRKNAEGQIDIVAHAREAELRVDLARGLLLVHMRSGVAIGEKDSRAYFEDRKFDVILPPNFLKAGDNVRARDMTWAELLERRVELLEQQAEVRDEIAHFPRTPPPMAANERASHGKMLHDRHRLFEQQVRLIDVELLMRPALSLGCLCFILVGCPVGIWFSRGDYLSAFITCFLPIVLVYYPLLLCGTNLARGGVFNPATLVFAADGVVALGGVALFGRLWQR